MVTIRDLTLEDAGAVQQVAQILIDGFSGMSPTWITDTNAAMEEIEEAHKEGKISLIAVDENDLVVGWIGGQHDYAKVWELHPLVVRPSHQGQGIGRMLVQELETRVRARGASTLTLGSDDVVGWTSIYGVDIYPDVAEHIRNIRNLQNHPFEFYQKLGFVIIGLMPDANGAGKHDILMAKRVAVSEETRSGSAR